MINYLVSKVSDVVLVFQCLVYLSDTMDRDSLKLAQQYFSGFVSKHTAVLDALLKGTQPDSSSLICLKGNSDIGFLSLAF